MKTQLQMYSSRDLSSCGRILITKTFEISKLLDILSILDSDREFQKSLQIDLNRYIWSYKPSKVKHLALIGSTNEGGLSSIDVESKCKALRLTWIGRILTGIGWNDIITEYLKPVGLLFLLKCNYEIKFLSCFVPTFYKQMLDYAKERFFVDMSYAIIWNNKSVLIQNKSIYLKEWVEKGDIFVQD